MIHYAVVHAILWTNPPRSVGGSGHKSGIMHAAVCMLATYDHRQAQTLWS